MLLCFDYARQIQQSIVTVSSTLSRKKVNQTGARTVGTAIQGTAENLLVVLFCCTHLKLPVNHAKGEHSPMQRTQALVRHVTCVHHMSL